MDPESPRTKGGDPRWGRNPQNLLAPPGTAGLFAPERHIPSGRLPGSHVGLDVSIPDRWVSEKKNGDFRRNA